MRTAKGILAVLIAVVSMGFADVSESRAEAAAYVIDPDHSQVIFKV